MRPAWHVGHLQCNDPTRPAAHSLAVGKRPCSTDMRASSLACLLGEADIARKDADVLVGPSFGDLNQFSADSRNSLLMISSQISRLQERPWFGRLWGEKCPENGVVPHELLLFYGRGGRPVFHLFRI